MKTEILKAYYPYDLCVVSESQPSQPYRILRITSENYILQSSWDQEVIVPLGTTEFKPALYPLSRIDTPVRIRAGEYINPMEKIGQLLAARSTTLQVDPSDQWFHQVLNDYLQDKIWAPFNHEIMKHIYNLLYRFHFDLDHLIETGHAIDVTDLEFNPYNFYHINFI